MTEIKGTRTRHVVTFNPNKASLGEEIYIDIHKLKSDTCLVPDSLYLLFDFKNASGKSWFLNNLSKLLFERFMVKFSGEVVYDDTGESVLNVYKDLWKSENKHNDMIEFGIGHENLRKLISKDDLGASSGKTSKVSYKLMYDVHGTKQKIKLTKILEDHGFYAPYYMINNLQFLTTLPKATDIMVAQSGESVGGYTLEENLELEYETVENQDIALQVMSGYVTGRSLSYEHVTLMKTVEWDKSRTTQNETINLPQKKKKYESISFIF